jgi:hypothetical protein
MPLAAKLLTISILKFQVHGETLSSDDKLVDSLKNIKSHQTKAWSKIKMGIQKGLCLISYVKNEV